MQNTLTVVKFTDGGFRTALGFGLTDEGCYSDALVRFLNENHDEHATSSYFEDHMYEETRYEVDLSELS